MRSHRTFPLLVAAFALLAHARAQSPARRKTTDYVYAAFREADSIRRIERPIDDEARAAIEKLLPYRVHFGELSTHVLHVAFRGKKPVGLFYVRAEETEWGLADIGWAIALDGRIVGFTFLEARTARAEGLPSSQFGQSLIGRTLGDLTVEQAAPVGEMRADELEAAVRRSAMKATAVISVVWADETAKLADLAMLYEEFPGAERFRRVVLPAPTDEGSVTRGLLRVMAAQAQGHFELGCTIATVCRVGDVDVGVRWVLDTSGHIVRATPAASWATGELRTLCGALTGRRLTEDANPDNPLTRAANEIAAALATERRPTGRKAR